MAASGEQKTFIYTTEGRIHGFDELFQGQGIEWDEEHPFVIILWGSEGSGKSSMALELSCLGKTIQSKGLNAKTTNNTRCVLYYIPDSMAVPRIRQKFEAFNIGRFGGDKEHPHYVWLKDWGKELCISSGGTSLFIISYEGDLTFERLVKNIREDVDRIIEHNKKESGRFCFDEIVIVIDSVPAFKPPKEGDQKLSKIWSDILVAGQEIPVVVILVDEAHLENEVYPDRSPYLANVYIRLWQGDKEEIRIESGYCERYMQIVKAANSSHVRGPQLFRIQNGTGIEIHPSIVAYYNLLKQINEEARTSSNVLKLNQTVYTCFGHKDIDHILWSDFKTKSEKETIPVGSCNLLIGETGTYKTPLALYFAHEVVHNKCGKAIYFSFHDHLETIDDFMENMGMLKESSKYLWLCKRKFPDAVKCEDVKPQHQMVIQEMTSWFTPPEVFMSMVKRLIRAMGIEPGSPHGCRIVLDAISDLSMSYPRLTGKKGFLAVLVNTLRVYGVTTLFVFNESNIESAQDKTIVNLADNVFHVHKKSVAGKSSTILHIEQLGNRFSGSKGVMHIRREKIKPKEEKIIVQESYEAYRLDQNQQLVPTSIKLYVNQRAPSHSLFNKAVCRAHGLSDDQLDENLAIQRGEAYWHNLQNLLANEDKSVVMAVDEDCLRTPILKSFVDLSQWNKELKIVENPDKDAFCNLEVCELEKSKSIRVLPSLLDCTILTCNLKILKELSSVKTKSLSILKKIIEDAQHKLLEKDRTNVNHLQELLPALPWQLLRDVATDFRNSMKGKRVKKYRFLGFVQTEELESLVVLFLDLLHNIRIVKKDAEQYVLEKPDIGKLKKIVEILADASDIYLGDCSCLDEPTPDNCLFYYTWHAILYPCRPKNLVPVKLVSIKGHWHEQKKKYHNSQNSAMDITSQIHDPAILWNFTRGGYYWGILDNGLGGEKARHVLQYASNDTMNLFRIKQRVGMPPREKFYVNTGELSIYNLGLMRSIFQGSWSRTEYINYHLMASHIRVFIAEYIEYLTRREPIVMNEEGKKELKQWLMRFVGTLLERVQEENKRKESPYLA